MKTVGEILKDARLKKKLSLDTVEKFTKIRKKFLLGIENDDFSLIPSISYAKGFVKNYSDYLGLNSDVTLAFFRRQTKDVTKSSLLPKGVSDPLNAPFFQLTPGRFMMLVVIGLVCIFLLYFGLQYRRIQTPPSLVIDSPKSNVLTVEKRVDVYGSTDPDATITINGVNVQVHPDGKFFDQVALDKGLTAITIVATSRYGKSTIVSRTIEFQGP
jgi:cytoskeletal protein RodZ